MQISLILFRACRNTEDCMRVTEYGIWARRDAQPAGLSSSAFEFERYKVSLKPSLDLPLAQNTPGRCLALI
jgi:hypothetical protein